MKILLIIFALTAIAFYTLRERKFLRCIQYQKGSNRPTISTLTILIDYAIKLFTKEEKHTVPTSKSHYLLTPIVIVAVQGCQ